MGKEAVRKELNELVEGVVQDLNYDFVDLEYQKEGERWVLRVFIDSAAGIGLEDCEKVSKAISRVFDEKDPIPNRYLLEVSSPGLDRPLKKEADFMRFAGSIVLVKTYTALNDRKKFQGTLIGLEGENIILKIEGDALSIPREMVSSVRLVPQF